MGERREGEGKRGGVRGERREGERGGGERRRREGQTRVNYHIHNMDNKQRSTLTALEKVVCTQLGFLNMAEGDKRLQY